MKKIIFTLNNCNEEDVRRIEIALRLREYNRYKRFIRAHFRDA